MEGDLLSLISAGGDTAILIAMAGVGYHKLANRLTAIEAHLAAKRDVKRTDDNQG